MSDLLDRLRVKIPDEATLYSGRMDKFFNILPNNTGLTEEFLYTHQPTGQGRIPVFSTSKEPVGFLDDSKEVRAAFVILDGPAISVARKGYGGRLSVIETDSFIVHEDGYAISPRRQYLSDVNLTWFAGHYST